MSNEDITLKSGNILNSFHQIVMSNSLCNCLQTFPAAPFYNNLAAVRIADVQLVAAARCIILYQSKCQNKSAAIMSIPGV